MLQIPRHLRASIVYTLMSPGSEYLVIFVENRVIQIHAKSVFITIGIELFYEIVSSDISLHKKTWDEPDQLFRSKAETLSIAIMQPRSHHCILALWVAATD